MQHKHVAFVHDDCSSPRTGLREQMLSWLAHEIKSPLSAAAAASQLVLHGLRNREDSGVLEHRVLVIARQLTRMDEIINSILDAAQLEEGKLQLDCALIELGPFVQRIAAHWSEIHPEVEFVVSSADSARVEADQERLRQILDNLISNAIKYGQPSRQVQLSVYLRDRQALITVRDQGRGIDPAELPHIFNRFHRVAGEGGRGHGFGLYLAATLARLLGGSLSAESELGHGSAFTLALPR